MNNKKVIPAHLVITKDLNLEHDGFIDGDLQENQIDESNFIIRGVAICSTRESKNGYSYTDQAFDSLVKHAEGSHVYLDHPSKSELKERDYVRSVRDLCGIFRNIKRNEDKVTGDLHTLESAFPWFKDIAKLSPKGAGMSINSRVKVYKDDEGRESIIDIDKLHSVDFVSSASLTSNLFESSQVDTEKEQKELEARINQEKQDEFAQEAITEFVLRASYEIHELNRKIKEGIIADQMKQDEIKRQTNQLIWKASDMVYDIIRDKEMTIADKKDRVTEILDDLDIEIQKAMKKIKPVAKAIGDEEPEMASTKELTVEIPTVEVTEETKGLTIEL